MTANRPLSSTQGTPKPLAPSERRATPAIPDTGGPAFQALLEKLEGQARGLESASRTVDGPHKLAGAVDQAKESYRGALELRDRLLEAFRAAQQSGGGADGR